MMKRVSAHWDFENNIGTIIIHDKTKVYDSFRSPAKTQKEFEIWVRDQKKILDLLKDDYRYKYA